MGLDMYLYKRIYVGNKYRKPENKVQVIIPENDGGTFPINKKSFNPNKIAYIVEEAAYWRKSNSIHNFFVQEVQGGTDDCGEYYVKNEVLQRLVEFCKEDIKYLESLPYQLETYTDFISKQEKQYKVYENVDEYKINLEPTSGFFFGSTEFDEFYVDDLKKTVEMIEPLLEDKSSDYYYTSSW